jgi:hypothetical protein
MNSRTIDLRNAAMGVLAAAGLIAALPQARADQLEVERRNGVWFVHGGIGDEEQRRIRDLGDDMSLKTIFARADGAYVADVDVTIKNTKGNTVLQVRSADPLLYAELPAGRYTIVAQHDGKALERNVSVPSLGQQAVYFAW